MSFYDRVFNICRLYFGEETKMFLERQIIIHLSKKPDQLDYQDKEKLAKWIEVSAGMMLGKHEAKLIAQRVLALKPESESSS